MKKFFDKENFVLSSFDPKARRQSLVLSLLLIFFFAIAAFTFFNMLYCFADVVGSIVSGSPDVAILDFLRSLPVFLTFFMTLWGLLLLHAFFRNVSEERRIHSLKKDATTILSFAGLNIVYILSRTVSGAYLSLVEGSPSALYPLDALLYSLLFVAIGVLALVYAKKWQDKLPYVVPSRGPIVKRARFVYCLFVTFWMLFALYGFGAFWIGLFIIDFLHGYLFFSIALLLVFLVNFLFLAVWEFYFNELKEEKRKEFLLPLSLVGLGCSAVTAVIYFIALGNNLDGPSNVGFGVLPVAFAASVNIATLLLVATPVIVSIVALVKGLLARKALKAAE
ncbi:MAG: hypothetical protein K6E59_06480 [Bacilli bacterium]|nr:hypothetical protein [Bacilli bacterium]